MTTRFWLDNTCLHLCLKAESLLQYTDGNWLFSKQQKDLEAYFETLPSSSVWIGVSIPAHLFTSAMTWLDHQMCLYEEMHRNSEEGGNVIGYWNWQLQNRCTNSQERPSQFCFARRAMCSISVDSEEGESYQHGSAKGKSTKSWWTLSDGSFRPFWAMHCDDNAHNPRFQDIVLCPVCRSYWQLQ